jgi:hypothetical protein
MTKDEIQMKEYEVLTQEILEHQKRREQLFHFTIVALGVILGFALKEEGISFLLISFIPYLLIFNFCHSTAINSGHIITIGTYLRHYIESNHKESLHWQTVWNDVVKKDNEDKNAVKKNKGKGYWFSFCFLASIVIFVGITFISVIQKKLAPLNLPGLLTYISFGLLQGTACFFCILKGVMLIHWSNMNQKERERWNKYWQDKNQLNNKDKEIIFTPMDY